MRRDDRFRHHEGDDGVVWLDPKTYTREVEPVREPSFQAWLLFWTCSVAFFGIGVFIGWLGIH